VRQIVRVRGCLEAGRNLCLFDTVALTPAGVSIFPEGCQVYLFPTPCSIYIVGNSRISPGSNVVVIASLLEVLLGTRRFGTLEAWWKFSGGRIGFDSSSFSSSHRYRYYFLFFSF
jgi:hypothetical protein